MHLFDARYFNAERISHAVNTNVSSNSSILFIQAASIAHICIWFAPNVEPDHS